MKRVFADTSFYQALLNPQDRWHDAALEFSRAYNAEVVTTEYVLLELGALMAPSRLRRVFLDLVTALKSDPHTDVLPASPVAFDAGLTLFAARLDKDWSLTDCISFATMRNLAISEALASDHHFEQAGFRVVLFA